LCFDALQCYFKLKLGVSLEILDDHVDVLGGLGAQLFDE